MSWPLALASLPGKGTLSPGSRKRGSGAWPTRGPGQAEGSASAQTSPYRLLARPGGGVMCHGHCQVAGSQAGGAVMSGEGSGRAEGQERLPLRLLQAAAPFLSPCPLKDAFLTSAPTGRPPSLPRSLQPSLPTPPAHQPLPGEGFHSRGPGRDARLGRTLEKQFKSAVQKAELMTITGV